MKLWRLRRDLYRGARVLGDIQRRCLAGRGLSQSNRAAYHGERNAQARFY
jgi:hypothetical protein